MEELRQIQREQASQIVIPKGPLPGVKFGYALNLSVCIGCRRCAKACHVENNHDRGDYLEYFGGALRPDYLKRGTDGQIYSIHLPGVSALVAPVLALGGYAAVMLFLSLFLAYFTQREQLVIFKSVAFVILLVFGGLISNLLTNLRRKQNRVRLFETGL